MARLRGRAGWNRRWSALVLLAGLMGCGAELPWAAGPGDGEYGWALEVERHERFIGTWLIDQPTHALYEATVYKLAANGDVGIVDAFPDGYETGRVRALDPACEGEDPWACEPLASCTFRGPWNSSGPERLFMGAACDDGQMRTVELTFAEDVGTDTSGVAVEIERVGNWRTTVEHDGPPWHFARCAEEGAEDPSGWPSCDLSGWQGLD